MEIPAVRIARTAFLQTAREFLLLPFWWYGEGLIKMIAWFRESMKHVLVLFGLRIWMKNLFVPMYGDTGFTGRLLSFGIRFFMILVRGAGVGSWFLFLFLLMVAYLFVLPLLSILLLIQLFGMLFG